MNSLIDTLTTLATASLVKADNSASKIRDDRGLQGRILQAVLFTCGIALIGAGLTADASAYSSQAIYNDDRIAEAADVMLTYINGTFGALIMVTAGVFAIMSAAFGQYRAALSLLVVAIGSFILRSLVSTWFNDASMRANNFR